MRPMLLLAALVFTTPARADWMFESPLDKLDGSIRHLAGIDAIESTVHPHRRDPRPTKALLLLSCDRKAFQLFVRFGDDLVAGRSRKVSYRVDERPPARDRKWSNSVDYTQVGSWKTPGTIAIAKDLRGGRRLFVRVEDRSFGTAEASFDISDFDWPASIIADKCGLRWPPK